MGHHCKVAKEETQSKMPEDAATSWNMCMYFVALLRGERLAEIRMLSVMSPSRPSCHWP